MSDKEIDEATGVETTGHEWDGIKELNNPMPRWWLWTFYATILFSIGYCIYYPAIPLIDGATRGIANFSTRANLAEDVARAEEGKFDLLSRIEITPLEDIRHNEELFRFATTGGRSLYKVYCSTCHGSGAQGAPGYPNLNDDAWIWGGDLDAIYTSISHGVRNTEDDDARYSEMIAFGRDGVLGTPEIRDVAEYVLKLSGQSFDVAGATRGALLYADNCVACHGENGEGVRDMGGPDIQDAIWLYGGSRAEIIAQVQNPKHGVMPPWLDRLGPASVKQLAIYVHSLGGGEKARTE